MKTVAIHQPNYLPWIGFFSKIKYSNYFIILNTAEYPKGSIINRNKIRTNEGWNYLTIPIGRRLHGTRICDIKLPIDKTWMITHWRTIKHHYMKANFFRLHQNFFKNLYQKDFEYLWQINEEIIFYLFGCFGIKVEVKRASELHVNPDLRKTDMVIELLKSVNADTYLSGPSGRVYLDYKKFKQSNIDLKFFEFKHPVYRQRYNGFESTMSAIDLLFNVGSQSCEILEKCGHINSRK